MSAHRDLRQILYAHTPNTRGDWHALEDHLNAVAEIAGEFCAKYGMREIGRLVGLLHDIGKANPDFQDYLLAAWEGANEGRHRPTSVPHSIYGACGAVQIKADLLAPVTAAHHGGLQNLSCMKNSLPAVPPTWLADFLPNEPAFSLPGLTAKPLSCEFLIRMLFSALVDADWLDTEAHFDSCKTARRGNAVTMSQLWELFQADQARLLTASTSGGGTPVNQARREIYEMCVNAAGGPQGVYKLTVPTGGGKTRSGMAFALRQAIVHNLDRIVFAIPYTSIIDQTVDVYADIFGADNVLEHHSAIEPVLDATEAQTEVELRRQLASENWDAPVVVTTTVQLFESLFANRPSRCRKLHNLARSILVLDEVQTLPVHLLAPILDVLRELVEHYGVTLVLSTATQPAFSGESPYLRGFSPEPTEIVPEPGKYFEALKRVEYRIEAEPWSCDRVADEVRGHEQALCVVNSRKDAVALFQVLDDPSALHLSTLMCPAHRRDTLADIRRRLEAGAPCRVISTQVVEAGVDLDFPVVLRAMGPLDRIVQAAGRCNREGRLAQGQVIVFNPADGRAPKGSYATATGDTAIILSDGDCNLHSPEVFARYFRLLWQDCDLDSYGILESRQRFNYQTVAERFRMIAEDTVPVVVSYGNPGPEPILQRIERKGSINRDEWRILQNLSVSIYRYSAARYEKEGRIRKLLDGLYVWDGLYSGNTGISEGCPDPADLVVA